MAVTGAAAWVAKSALGTDHHLPLPRALPVEYDTLVPPGVGELALYRSLPGEGPTVLLVHSVNAAASSAEMRPIFMALAGRRPVAALDLPGFGHSDRSAREYTPELMTDAIVAAVEHIGGPVHLVALSLSSEFAARAAMSRPDLVRSVTMISPTGFGRNRRRDAGGDGASLVARILDTPVVGQAIYDLLVTPLAIRFFLGRSFSGSVDQTLVNQAVFTGHQPGARHAPFAFIRGELFTPDAIESLYAKMDVPTTVLYDRDAYTDFAELAEFVGDRPQWRAERIADTNGLPQFDAPQRTLDALESFWERVAA